MSLSQSNGLWITRLVWATLWTAAAGGAATLFLLLAGVSRHDARSRELTLHRDEGERVQRVFEHTLLPVADDIRAALTPPFIAPRQLSLSRQEMAGVDEPMAALLGRASDLITSASRLSADLTDTHAAIMRLKRGHHELGELLANEIDSAVGRERLQAIIAIRSQSTADEQAALSAALERLENAREISVHIVEILHYTNMLLASNDAADVVDIKRNRIEPRLWQLEMLIDRHPDWNEALSPSLSEFRISLTGAPDHVDGNGGLYLLVDRRLALRSQTDALMEALTEFEVEAVAAAGVKRAAVALMSAAVASKTSALFRRALFWTALIGLVSMVLMLIVGRYVTRAIRTQVEHLNDARIAAEAATRAKSDFLSNMSHEIRTPMTAIVGFAETLSDPDTTLTERSAAVRTIRRSGEHLLTIINDILDLSKIESGQMPVECMAYSPLQLVCEVESIVRGRFGGKHLSFGVDYLTALPERITTDPTRVRQILVNMISNAVKFTESGFVRLEIVWLEPQPDLDGGPSKIRFDVVDSGMGMTGDTAARLFSPFMQADASMTRRFGGTGLGLHISRHFARLLGGDVELVESSPGRGSRFRATIATGPLNGVGRIEAAALRSPESAAAPVPQNACTTPAANSDAAPGPADLPLTGRRVLLAEDGVDNQRLISLLLRKAGAYVTIVDNGRDAVHRALARHRAGEAFDVILMDMQMPILDGYEATRSLREMEYGGPIIALTAHAMSGDRDRCVEAGCDDYSTKPIDRARLIELVAQYAKQANAVPITESAIQRGTSNSSRTAARPV